MNIIKAQQELLTSLINGQRAHCFTWDKSYVLILPDNGTRGYIIHRPDLHVKIEEKPMPKLSFPRVTEENRLTPTNQMVAEKSGKLVLQMYTRADGEKAWVWTKLLSNFKAPTLYKDSSLSSPILVTEGDVPVGFVMPHRPPKENN